MSLWIIMYHYISLHRISLYIITVSMYHIYDGCNRCTDCAHLSASFVIWTSLITSRTIPLSLERSNGSSTEPRPHIAGIWKWNWPLIATRIQSWKRKIDRVKLHKKNMFFSLHHFATSLTKGRLLNGISILRISLTAFHLQIWQYAVTSKYPTDSVPCPQAVMKPTPSRPTKFHGVIFTTWAVGRIGEELLITMHLVPPTCGICCLSMMSMSWYRVVGRNHDFHLTQNNWTRLDKLGVALGIGVTIIKAGSVILVIIIHRRHHHHHHYHRHRLHLDLFIRSTINLPTD